MTRGRWVVNDREPLTCWKNTYLHEFAIKKALLVNCDQDDYGLWLILCYEKHGLRRRNIIIMTLIYSSVFWSHLQNMTNKKIYFLSCSLKRNFTHSVVIEPQENSSSIFSLCVRVRVRTKWIQTNWWADGLLSFLGQRDFSVSLSLSSILSYCVSICLVKLQF